MTIYHFNMTTEQINHLKDLQVQIHENAKKKGFHSQGTSDTMLVALIVEDLSGALSAFRSDRRIKFDFCTYVEPMFNDIFKDGKIALFTHNFVSHIKGAVEEEFADIVIRCLDFMALKSFEIAKKPSFKVEPNFEGNFFKVVKLLSQCSGHLEYGENELDLALTKINYVVIFMFSWASQLGFDLMPFIELKMKYNTTREYLHGKKF